MKMGNENCILRKRNSVIKKYPYNENSCNENVMKMDNEK